MNLKKLLEKSLKNQLIAGSFILFVGTMFSNFGSYLYHLLMGRLLGPEDYGALTSLISLTYILSIISATLSLTVVKFVTQYKVKKDYRRIFQLFWQLTRGFFVFGIIVFGIFVLARGAIGQFLNLSDSSPVVLVGILMFFYFLAFLNEGILRGFLKFGFLSFSAILTTIFKISLAVILVKLGFSLIGAFGAIIFGSVLSYLISFYPLRFLFSNREGLVFQADGLAKIDWRDFFSYTTPVLLATLGLTSLYSTDVILARHFFPSLEAGLYASLAVMGKIIFFASSTVPAVMFPLVSEKFENGKPYRTLIMQSLWLVLGGSLVITLVYFLFPRLMIGVLYGPSYLGAAPFLGLFAIFITLYSLNSLLVNFFLSVRRVRLSLLPLLAAVGQIVGIWFFHRSILQVIQISLIVNALLLFSLLIYYLQDGKEKRPSPIGCYPGR